MTVLEKAAKALLAKVPLGYGMTKAEAIEYVRAALEDLKQVDEHTKFAMKDAWYDTDDDEPVWESLGTAFTAAIDHILKGES